MSSQPIHNPETSPWVLRRARWNDHSALARWMEQQTATNLFALSWLEKHGLNPSVDDPDFQWWLAVEPRGAFGMLRPRLHGICLVLAHRMIVPMTHLPKVAQDFGQLLAQQNMHLEHVMGQHKAVTHFWDSYNPLNKARLIRDQTLYTLDARDLITFGNAPLRQARSEDLEPVVQASAAMYLEETLSDPYGQSPGTFRVMHHRRIQERRTWIWTRPDDGSIIFKAEMSCSSSYGAQIAGVYTDPTCRGQGIARQGLGILCQRLLTRFPQISLYVNNTNIPATRVYKALGFQQQSQYSSVFVT